LFYFYDINSKNSENNFFDFINSYLSKDEKNYVLFLNDWLLDRIYDKIKQKTFVNFVISFTKNKFCDYWLVSDNASFGINKLLNIINYPELKLDNFYDEISYLLNNGCLNSKFDNLYNVSYVDLKKYLLTQSSCVCNYGLKEDFFLNTTNNFFFKNWTGCSFCKNIVTKQNLSLIQEFNLIKKQITLTLNSNSKINKFIINDRVFGFYFFRLINFLKKNNYDNLELYIQSRVDIFNSKFSNLVKFLKSYNGNLKFIFYLIGFENFSQKMLDIFNKKIKVSEIILCIKRSYFLEQKFMNVKTTTRSHGFIMYTPWTSMIDIQKNNYFAKKYDFKNFCPDWDSRILRLEKGTPLFFKAKEDGLLLKGNNCFNYSDTKGYFSNVNWKFKYKDVENYFNLKFK